MIRSLTTIVFLISLLAILSGCGGGAGSTVPPTSHTKATVKLALSGTLPAGVSIAGAGVSITLPPGVTVSTDSNGAVTAGTVTPSGIFATGTQTTPIYTSASGGSAATLKLGLASGTVAGESQIGEIVAIVFNLADGATPIASSFALTDFAVVDATSYAMITGLSGLVTTVTIQ